MIDIDYDALFISFMSNILAAPKANDIKIYKNFNTSNFNFNISRTFCDLNLSYIRDAFQNHRYSLLAIAPSIEAGAFLVGSIIDNSHFYIDVICSNKFSVIKTYTHDGAATLLLDTIINFVDFINKYHNAHFFLKLHSVPMAQDYYFRKNFNPTGGIKDGLIAMVYGGTSNKNPRHLSKRQKELKRLRSSDGGKGFMRSLQQKIKDKQLQKIIDKIPPPIRDKSPSRKSPTKKSRRLNPLKKYTYDIYLYVNKDTIFPSSEEAKLIQEMNRSYVDWDNSQPSESKPKAIAKAKAKAKIKY